MLGRIALERGWIGPDALARAIEAKERARGPAAELPDILVAQGALTEAQKEALLEAARGIGRRRAAVKWAVAQAGKADEEALDAAAAEAEASWAGVASVEVARAPEPPSRARAEHAGAAEANEKRAKGSPEPVPRSAEPPSRRTEGSRGAAAVESPARSAPSASSASPGLARQPPPQTPTQRIAPTVEEDLAVAKIAMERGLVTLAEVREGLEAQADFAAIGRPLPLGQVLIKRRAIDVDTFVDVAREARERSVRCASCGVLSLLPKPADLPAGASLEGRCPRCGGPLPLRAPSRPGPEASAPAALEATIARGSTRGVPERPRTPTGTPALAPPPPERAHSPVEAKAAVATAALAPSLASPASAPAARGPEPAVAPARAAATGSPASAPAAASAPASATATAPPPPAATASAATAQAAAAAGAAPAAPAKKRPHDSLAGKAFGRYDVIAEIARGGMGVVYRARDRDLDRVVALKVLKDGVAASEKQIRRFKREVDAAGKLKHPNIVPVYDVGIEQGRHYFTMEFVDGVPLDELIRRGPVDVERALGIAEQLCRAIHHAHESGVIHRDLKPANAILDKRGVPKITDFGLAKNVDHVSAMTKTGAAVGTPFYMPPEQARGDAKKIDCRVDVYAIGVILYELLTSELPFDGETTLEVYHKILQDEVPAPSKLNAACDAEVDLLVRKAMAKERDDRYASALEFADDIRRRLEGRKVAARPPGAIKQAARRARRLWPAALAVAGALVVAGALAAVIVISRRQRDADERAEVARIDLERFEDAARARLRAGQAARGRAQSLLDDGKAAESVAAAAEALVPLVKPASKRLDEFARERARPEDAASPEAAALRDQTLAAARAFLDDLEAKEARPLVRDLEMLEGRALARSGDAEEARDLALAAFARALEVDPKHAEARLERGAILSARGKLEEAEDELTKAVELRAARPEVYPLALLARGDVRARRGRHAAAVEDYAALAAFEEANAKSGGAARFSTGEHEPTRLAVALLRRALSLAALGREADALAEVKTLTDADGGLAAAWVVASTIALGAEQFKTALAAAEQAIQSAPQQGAGYVAKGRVLLALGRALEAERCLEEGLRRDPRAAAARLELGVALDRQGDVDGARAAFAAAKSAAGGGDPETRARAALRLAELERTAPATATPGASPAGGGGGAAGSGSSGNQGSAPPARGADPVRALLDEALALDPRLVAAYVARARRALALGDEERAREDAGRAEELARRRADDSTPGDGGPAAGGDSAAPRPLDAAERAALDALAGELDLLRGAAERGSGLLARARAGSPGGLFPSAAAAEGRALLSLGRKAEAADRYRLALEQEAAEAAPPLDDAAPPRDRDAAEVDRDPPTTARKLAAGPLFAARPDQEAAVFYRIGARAREEAAAQPGRAGAALQAFRRAAAIDPAHARASFEAARLLRERRSYGAALEAVERAVRANPFFVDALVERGALRVEAASAAEGGSPAPRTASALARLDFEAALALEPDRPDALFGRALALVAAGERESALADLERAIDVAERRAAAPETDAGRTAEARRLLAGAYDARAQMVAADGRADLAKADAARAKDLRGANRSAAEARYHEGMALFNDNKADEAIDKFTEAIAADRTYAPAWYGRGAARFKNYAILDAALDISRALELEPGYAEEAFQNAGNPADLFDLSGLKSQVDDVLKKSADDVPALFLEGLYGVVRLFVAPPDAETDASLAALDRVVALSPRHAFAYTCRAFLRQAKGDLDGAAQDVRRAERLAPKRTFVAFVEAVVAAKRGDRGRALDALERAADLGFHGADRLKGEKAFDALRDEPRWKALMARLGG